MRRRSILPFLCAAALILAAAPGAARVGSWSALPHPLLWSRWRPLRLLPAMSGSLATGAGTAFNMSGCQAHTSCPLLFTRYGCPEPGSGMATAGSGKLATGGGNGSEAQRSTDLTRRSAGHLAMSTPLPIDDADEVSPHREIIAATGEVIKLQWEEFHPGAAACCVPAIVIILVCGLVVGQPFAALVATAGAFSVGFGLFQRLSSFAFAPMLLALVGMTISATVGTLASASPLSEGIAAAIWAFGVAAAVGLGTAVWWIVLQWSIALVIAAAFPADPTFALLRGCARRPGRHASARLRVELVDARLLAMRCSGSPEREQPAALL